MKNKIIILIVSIIVIIVFLLGSIIYIRTNDNKDVITEDKKDDNLMETSNQDTVKSIDNNSQLLIVKNYIQSFIERINLNNVIYYTGGNKIDESIISKNIYNLLSKDYITKNSITEKNALNYVYKIEEKLTFIPLKVNVLKGSNYTKYSVYGFTYNQKNENKGDMYFILNIDNSNLTYSIEPIFNVNNINDIELNTEELTIEKNRYNTYVKKEYTEEDICEQYMTMYKALMLSNTNEAYKYLDNEYRNLKYGSLQEYKDFIISNNDDINDFEMKAYSINGNRYVCKDGKDNFYIFNVNKVLDYTVVLDTYTVDLPEFTEKYNKVSAQEKVALNINKVITALNDKDYKYIYNKLADSFKDNYFNNEDELKEYLSNKLYDNNEINFGKFSDEGNGIYTYEIELSEISNENEAAQEGKGDNFARIKMNVVMQLKEGTDFVMSFSIE